MANMPNFRHKCSKLYRIFGIIGPSRRLFRDDNKIIYCITKIFSWCLLKNRSEGIFFPQESSIFQCSREKEFVIRWYKPSALRRCCRFVDWLSRISLESLKRGKSQLSNGVREPIYICSILPPFSPFSIAVSYLFTYWALIVSREEQL